MTVDLAKIRADLEHEIETYPVPPPRHPDLVGSALPASWFQEGLTEMRDALVEPYLAEALWFDGLANERVARPVVVVAEDGQGHVVALEIEGDEFELLRRVDGSLFSMNVRGDAVGCFLAR
ncbi:MAG: hypothetical protein K0M78_04685 [Brevundimonas sp.]|nr:hypothetical protein [Brevundimonas sp.]